MPRKYVDLSMTRSNEVISDPPFLKPTITYETHADTKHELENFFPGWALRWKNVSGLRQPNATRQ
jgi:hypothetical protein